MIQINGTRGILTDNSYLYLIFLNAAVQHADPDANIRIEKTEDKLQITIFPGVQEFRQHILENVLSFHKLFSLKTDFAKSTKNMKNLYFSIKFGDSE